MEIKECTSEEIWSSGCDLWVMPQVDAFAWGSKMDWYVNFQISNFFKSNTSNIDQNFLVIPHNQLPTEGLMAKHYNGDQKKWLQACHQIWQDTGHKSMRVFLPSDIPLEEALIFFIGHLPEDENPENEDDSSPSAAVSEIQLVMSESARAAQ